MATPKKRKPEPVGMASVQKSNTPIVVAVAAVIAILAIIATVIAINQDKEDSEDAAGTRTVQWQPVSVTGAPLPQLPSGAADPAVGTVAPDVKGESFTGEAVNIANDGRAKAIVFLAHWCPHCQAEAPKLAPWIDSNKDKYDVDYYAVATGTAATSANFPPSEWLNDLNWPTPVLADDHASPAGSAFGLSSYPYMVFIGADGKVVSRTSGEIGVNAFEQYVAAAVGAGAAPAPSGDAATQSSPSVPVG